MQTCLKLTEYFTHRSVRVNLKEQNGTVLIIQVTRGNTKDLLGSKLILKTLGKGGKMELTLK